MEAGVGAEGIVENRAADVEKEVRAAFVGRCLQPGDGVIMRDQAQQLTGHVLLGLAPFENPAGTLSAISTQRLRRRTARYSNAWMLHPNIQVSVAFLIRLCRGCGSKILFLINSLW